MGFSKMLELNKKNTNAVITFEVELNNKSKIKVI